MSSANANMDAAAAHALSARHLLTEAQGHAHYVTFDHPALASGTTSLHAEIDKVEDQLESNGEYRATLRKAHNDMQKQLEAKLKSLEEYQPEKLEIPAPSATIDGRALDVETYGKISVNLEAGPFWGFAYFFGGVAGEAAESHGDLATGPVQIKPVLV